MTQERLSRVAIVGAARTPIGSFGGALREVEAYTLGAAAIRAALERAGVPADAVEEAILGQVLQAGLGPNPARRAAVEAGIPYAVPSMTVNKVCGSGLKAVALGASAIRGGDASLVVAGGMESMSRAPFLLPDARWGRKLGHGRALDAVLQDALWDCFYDCHMADTAEALAAEFGIARAAQDAYAHESQRRAAAAADHGFSAEEITPVPLPKRRGAPAELASDEHPRPDTTPEALAGLRPAFRPEGTITAGNASGVNDGAAAVVLASEGACHARGLRPRAWVRGWASVGTDPRRMGLGPAFAIERLLERLGRRLGEIDLIEVNEAFAAQVLVVGRHLNWDASRVNVNGGAIALGHPVGASGARVLVTLVHEMRRRDARTGLAALCIGGGQGIAMLVERDAG